MKKSAVESHLVEAYDKAALSETMCHDWFQRIKSGDFYVEDKKRAARPKLVEDAELEASFDETPYQMQEKLAESLGVAQSTIFMRLKT